MEEGCIRKNFTRIIFFLGILLVLPIIFAAHNITTSTGGSNFSVNESVEYTYNITVNTTDTLVTANITEVNITLPGSFNFTANSNGTSTGSHTFSNTTTVLTWANDSLVLNLSQEYFWFNATASTPGDYNLIIQTTNSTGTESTNISVTINDTSNPTVALLAPADANTSTTTNYNFTFTVTDSNTISNCSLILDDTVIHIITSSINNTGGTNSMYNTSLSVAAHNWSVNCSDASGKVGNSSTRTFTISEAAANDSTSTTPAGRTINPYFTPGLIALQNGYEKIMYKNWRIMFNLGNETHTIVLQDVLNKSVKINITSDVQEANLSLGEKKMFELTGDDYYDLSIKLNQVYAEGTSNERANLTIQIINEPISSAEGEEPTTGAPGEGKAESGSNAAITIIIILALIVVGIIIARIVKKR